MHISAKHSIKYYILNLIKLSPLIKILYFLALLNISSSYFYLYKGFIYIAIIKLSIIKLRYSLLKEKVVSGRWSGEGALSGIFKAKA